MHASIVLSLFLLLVGGCGASLAQSAPLVAEVAAENARLSSLIAEEQAALDRDREALAVVRDADEQLAGRLQRIAHHAELQAGGREFAELVRRGLRDLPRPEQYAAVSEQRRQSLELVSDTAIRAETALLGLTELDAAVGRRLGAARQASSPPPGTAERDVLRERLADQRDLYGRLHSLAVARLSLLQETGRTEARLLQRSADARTELTRQLLWLPSRPERHLVADLMPALQWVSSGDNWAAVGETFAGEVKHAGLAILLAGVVALGLFVARPRLRRLLDTLASDAAVDMHLRVRNAVAAIAVSVALALPVPLLVWIGATLLGSATTAPPFVLALVDALTGVYRLLLALAIATWLLHPRGVAAVHFGWDKVAVRHAEHALRRFAALFIPVAAFAALNALDHAPYANRETLGRLAFGLAMVVLTVLLVRLFQRSNPPMQHITRTAPRSWTVRLYPVWFLALLAFPLGMLALSASGHLTAAAHVFARTTMTFFLVIAAGLLYGLAAVWVQVRQWGLERVGLEQDTTSPASRAGNRPGGGPTAVVPQRIDLTTIGAQARSLLDLTLAVLLLSGLWWIWRDAIPALSAIGDLMPWSHPTDGPQAGMQQTITRVVLATVIAAVTWVVVANVGALLDFLLQRLDFQADANYAIKVIARYTVTCAGVVLACGMLGIAWDDVQWLVAALGVGLGFGLQEIVANFVSGLIVLAERPVRIGDVVTINDVTGRVSRIRARATVLIDADNREILVPNKGFITERVVNWTLTDTTIRLLIPFTVAPGSDIERVRRLVLEAAGSTAGIMREPAPSVFCVGLDENSLRFEMAAYVRSGDDLPPVRHALIAAIDRALRQSGVSYPG